MRWSFQGFVGLFWWKDVPLQQQEVRGERTIKCSFPPSGLSLWTLYLLNVSLKSLIYTSCRSFGNYRGMGNWFKTLLTKITLRHPKQQRVIEKQDWEAPLVTNPPRGNSAPLQYPLFPQTPLYISRILKPTKQFKINTGFGCITNFIFWQSFR